MFVVYAANRSDTQTEDGPRPDSSELATERPAEFGFRDSGRTGIARKAAAKGRARGRLMQIRI